MGFKLSDVVQVEAVYCPEAIEAWYSITRNKNEKIIGRSDFTTRAKMHLSAMGWVLWYAHKGQKRELRYTSPTGKCFYSLRTACKSCIEDDGGKGRELGFLAHQEISGSSGDRALSLRSRIISVSSDSGKSSSSRSGTNSAVSESKKRKKKEEKSDDCVDGDETEIKGRRGKSMKKTRKLASKTKRKITEKDESDDMMGEIIEDDEIVIKPSRGKSMKKLLNLKDMNRNASKRPLRSSRRLRSASPNSKNHLNDDICSVCHYGGDLVLCDGCPSAFHSHCLGLTDIPDEEFWFCPSCCCGICVAGESKVESFMICEQCQHKFHVGCLKSDVSVSDKHWFCTTKCEGVFSSLQDLVGKGIRVGEDNLVWILLKTPDPNHNSDVNGKTKLHRALDVMHECFEPSYDPVTGRDVVEDVIFGRKSELTRTIFPGFYTIVLERNNKLISVATVRIFRDLAEIPLVATRFKYRKKGMCRVLMNELERQMLEIGVERLVLHAAPNVLGYWTGPAGFSKMEDSERFKLLDYSFLDFQDTIMCHKILLEKPDSAKSSLTEEN